MKHQDKEIYRDCGRIILKTTFWFILIFTVCEIGAWFFDYKFIQQYQ